MSVRAQPLDERNINVLYGNGLRVVANDLPASHVWTLTVVIKSPPHTIPRAQPTARPNNASWLHAIVNTTQSSRLKFTVAEANGTDWPSVVNMGEGD